MIPGNRQLNDRVGKFRRAGDRLGDDRLKFTARSSNGFRDAGFARDLRRGLEINRLEDMRAQGDAVGKVAARSVGVRSSRCLDFLPPARHLLFDFYHDRYRVARLRIRITGAGAPGHQGKFLAAMWPELSLRAASTSRRGTRGKGRCNDSSQEEMRQIFHAGILVRSGGLVNICLSLATRFVC